MCFTVKHQNILRIIVPVVGFNTLPSNRQDGPNVLVFTGKSVFLFFFFTSHLLLF